MAAKKKSAPRSANAAEKDMMDKKAKSRTDASGRSGMGASTAPLYWKKGDASWNAAKKTLESKGVDPMKYSKETGSFKGQKPIYDYLEANSPKMKFLSGKSAGMKGLMKSTPDKEAYKRISTEMKSKSSKVTKKK
jgi:hypothetical protein